MQHKILEGRWKSKTCLQKPFFEILSGFFHFLPLCSPMSLLNVENFFPSNMRMGYQKIRLFIMISKMYIWSWYKSALKTVLVPENSVFWVKLFWFTFYEGQMYNFKISRKSRIFLYPIRPIRRKKSFHFIIGQLCTVSELKSPKLKQPINISENGVFLTQFLDIHRPSKILCRTSRRQNHWSLLQEQPQSLHTAQHIHKKCLFWPLRSWYSSVVTTF